MYDTFEGMTQLEKQDVDWDGNDLRKMWERDTAQKENPWWGYGGTIEEVRDTVYASNYPKDNFVFVKGPVEDTVPDTVPEKSRCCAWIRTGIPPRIMSLSICIRS